MQKTDLAELRRLHEAAMQEASTPQDLRRSMNAAYLALPALLDELEAARKENDFLRLRLAESDKACVYCNLPASEMPKCSSGFPGCARADDLYSCDELSRRDDRMKLLGAAEELEWLVDSIGSGLVMGDGEFFDGVETERRQWQEDLRERAAKLRQEAGQ